MRVRSLTRCSLLSDFMLCFAAAPTARLEGFRERPARVPPSVVRFAEVVGGRRGLAFVGDCSYPCVGVLRLILVSGPPLRFGVGDAERLLGVNEPVAYADE